VLSRRRVANFWWLLKRAFIASYEDGVFGIAKGAAYSALLSFFPVLTAAAAILVQAKAQAVSRVISGFLFEVIPPGTEELVQYSFAVRGQRPIGLLVLATLLSLWASSGLMISLMEGFQAAYKLPSGRPFLKQRGVAILLVLVSAVPVLGASSLILFGTSIERMLLSAISREDILRGWVLLIGQVLRYALALGGIVVVTGLLFYLGPNRKQRWNMVWPGAIVATFLWLITTLGFAWYVRNIANYNVMYGSIGAVIAMLVWMYLLAAIALVGCEYNAEREKLIATLRTMKRTPAR
jgi:membrane protein